jgi:hypothetical protein
MSENQFSNCLNLQVFRINSNNANIFKFIPSNALPQSQYLTIYVNTDNHRVIMEAKYPKATVLVDDVQYDNGGQAADTIIKKNRK